MEPLPRLSPLEIEILALLRTHGESYGLDLVQASSLLKRGTVYITLDRMVGKGLVTGRAVPPLRPDLQPRRAYTATALGRRALSAWLVALAVFDHEAVVA